MTKEHFTFFWAGPFSQWHLSLMVIDGVTYCCAEQYMMAMKALTFGDQDIHDQIMATQSPEQHKLLGRKVQNFDAARWQAVSGDIVYKVSYAKYTQDQALQRDLLATKGTTLVEASPDDAIWGIGLAEHDPRAQSRATWLGTNYLGEILTQVRDRILQEQARDRT